jgi:broad specificity phosphatase PhoE
MRHIYFIRHGETEDNVRNVYSGQADTPLTSRGRREAREAVPKIAGYHITHVISSDLERAEETAKIIADGIKFPRGLIQATPDLREVAVGSLTGKPYRGREYIIQMRRHDPGIETTEHVYHRLRHLIHSLPEEGNVLLVGHMGSGTLLHSLLTGGDPMAEEGLPNCGIMELKVPDDK